MLISLLMSAVLAQSAAAAMPEVFDDPAPALQNDVQYPAVSGEDMAEGRAVQMVLARAPRPTLGLRVAGGVTALLGLASAAAAVVGAVALSSTLGVVSGALGLTMPVLAGPALMGVFLFASVLVGLAALGVIFVVAGVATVLWE